jgi:hypothetical protein
MTPANVPTAREQAEEALRKFQDEAGLERGGANLWPGTAARVCADVWEPEVEGLREALNDIVHASRDEGLATMCNWMRGRAIAALQGENIGRSEAE